VNLCEHIAKGIDELIAADITCQDFVRFFEFSGDLIFQRGTNSAFQENSVSYCRVRVKDHSL